MIGCGYVPTDGLAGKRVDFVSRDVGVVYREWTTTSFPAGEAKHPRDQEPLLLVVNNQT